MNKFKVVFGYDAEDYITIDETELERATYAHMTGKNVAFSNGSVSGSRIVAIQPDFHSTMGWNRGYQLGVDDFTELREKGVDIKLNNMLASKKERVQYLIETGQPELIGKNVSIPEMEGKSDIQIKHLTQALTDKFTN